MAPETLVVRVPHPEVRRKSAWIKFISAAPKAPNLGSRNLRPILRLAAQPEALRLEVTTACAHLKGWHDQALKPRLRGLHLIYAPISIVIRIDGLA